MSHNGSLDEETTQHISKARVAFGRLTNRLWKSHDVKLNTKISVYKAAVLSALLYGCETWTTYRKVIRQLEAFHMRCLRRICNIRWQDRVPNTAILEKCGITSIEAYLIKSQLRWSAYGVRMDDTRIPQALFYGQLKGYSRPTGRPRMRYRDCLKSNMKKCGLNSTTWEADALNRSSWRSLCHSGASKFENDRITEAKRKRDARKSQSSTSDALYL